MQGFTSRRIVGRRLLQTFPEHYLLHQELAPDALSFSGLEIHPRSGEQVLRTGDFVREGLIGAVDVGAELSCHALLHLRLTGIQIRVELRQQSMV